MDSAAKDIMGKIAAELDQEMVDWIGRQKIFFVASAPLAESGHINLSPKGGDTLRVLSPNVVVYQDFTGSGIETMAHIRENGRLVIMFCAFEGAPQIIRLYGQGEVVTPKHKDFADLAQLFPQKAGVRSYIRLKADRVTSSCGFGVPFYSYVGERDVLDKWCVQKGPEALEEYRQMKNRQSIDGLPGWE